MGVNQSAFPSHHRALTPQAFSIDRCFENSVCVVGSSRGGSTAQTVHPMSTVDTPCHRLFRPSLRRSRGPEIGSMFRAMETLPVLLQVPADVSVVHGGRKCAFCACCGAE